ncbi:MAG TPA: translation initiation factor [Myxococcales bacterium]|jgi:translation initiation factor 1|nr:translation initiation factor [Myxococcales bacterium]
MTDEKKPFHNPFGALRDKLGDLPAGPAPAPPAPAKGPARAVVRMERKGRGGKEVTAIEQLDLRPRELDLWLKDLKAALGCGGAVEGDALVLQGDQRKRLPGLLAARGVRKITVG